MLVSVHHTIACVWASACSFIDCADVSQEKNFLFQNDVDYKQENARVTHYFINTSENREVITCVR